MSGTVTQSVFSASCSRKATGEISGIYFRSRWCILHANGLSWTLFRFDTHSPAACSRRRWSAPGSAIARRPEPCALSGRQSPRDASHPRVAKAKQRDERRQIGLLDIGVLGSAEAEDPRQQLPVAAHPAVLALQLSVQDPDNPYRYVEIRGRVVAMTEDGADAHIDALAKKYIGQERYPWRQPGEVRVMVKILPERVHGM